MFSFKELINVDSLKKIAENIYEIAGVHMAIADAEGTAQIIVGDRDICTNYHRMNQTTCNRCLISDKYSNIHIRKSEYIEYKCLNNMRHIAIPIIMSGMCIATIFFSQFFYDDEEINIECFKAQALEFGFDEKGYLDALSRVPILSRCKVKHIIEYYKGIIMMLVESGLRQLECKNSQKKLKKSQNYLDTILNSVNDAILIYDIYGNILDVNKAAISMLGYCRNELINMNVDDIISQNSYDFNFNKENTLKKIEKINPLILEGVFITKSGKECWVEGNIRIINIDGEKRIISVARDITERKQNELRLYNEALELEKLKTQFFANISHELKTPLNVILGTNKIIDINVQEENIDRVKINNNINIERNNCFRLLRLINNLIDATKLDSGELELNMVNCNIVNIIEEITLSVANYVNSKKLNFTFDTEIEEKIIACDLDKIERIMLNIFSNAVKFTGSQGNIFVNIFDGEEFIIISVEDNGIGISEDKVDVIFDKFRQVDKSFTRNCEGSGVGLSLVKALVEMQGGKISVQSKCGVGTKFCIRLPVKLIHGNNNEENVELFNNRLNNYIEKIKIEFSDIYTL